MRLSEEQLQAILDRQKASGFVRTVKCQDDVVDKPLAPRAAPAQKPLKQVLAEIRCEHRVKRKPKPAQPCQIIISERQVLRACLDLLLAHPKVAFAWRQNTGAMRLLNGQKIARSVRFSFKGCSDILGLLKGGRFLAIECKRTGKTASEDQQEFLDVVASSGGFSICVDDAAKLAAALEAL